MNIEELIIENFELVNKVFFENEKNETFLRIEVKLHDLNELIEYSKKINKFIDQNDKHYQNYYLDIYSSGTEIKIDKNNLEKYIDKNVFVKLKNPIKQMKYFEGIIIENSEEFIIVKWNAKGQFRKQIIEKDNIEDINLSAKIKKIKKVKNEKRRI